MQSQHIVLSQKQQLKLSPQMYQSLELMTLPILELREHIQQEIEKNPALEIQESTDTSFDAVADPVQTTEYDYFENTSDPGYIPKSGSSSEDLDAKQRFLEGALSRSESLQEHLMEQLNFSYLDPEAHLIGEIIISNLDENGFYTKPLDSLFDGDRLELALELVEMIQGFEPPGICVADYKESLIVQTRLREDAPQKTIELIDSYLVEAFRGQESRVLKALELTSDELAGIKQFIQTLNPFPGSAFRTSQTQYIVPDLEIRMVQGRLRMSLNRDQIPVITIDPEFEELAEQAANKAKKEVDSYIQRSLREAQTLIASISMRNSTLKMVGASLMKHQYDFFIKGPKYLRPLTLKDIAEEISVHETTVSRISQAKYIQTDWGIFPIKFFFTNAVSGQSDDGKSVSKIGVKEIIKEIIDEYTGTRKLSDQKIADALQERGITVARRTVAKYRAELSIDSSFHR